MYERNVVAGNTGAGIVVMGLSMRDGVHTQTPREAHVVTVQGVMVGLDATGRIAVPNMAGVTNVGTSSLVVEDCVISANRVAGELERSLPLSFFLLCAFSATNVFF